MFSFVLKPILFTSAILSLVKKIIFVVTFFVLVFFLLRARSSKQLSIESAPSFNCIHENCPEIAIQNDPVFSVSGRQLGFFGYADPSIKKDPNSDTIWLAYSWPNAHIVPDQEKKIIPGVDLHLAKSLDQGKTWTFVKEMWTSSESPDPETQEIGFIDREVLDIEAIEMGGKTEWISAHMEYFIPKEGGRSSRPASSFLIQLSSSPSLLTLPDSPKLRFGGSKTDSSWDIDLNLTSLDPELEKCAFWNEPALLLHEEKVYLALRCLAFAPRSQRPDMQESDYAFFMVAKESFADAEAWEFAGLLQTDEVAEALGGASLTQMDLVISGGKILAIVTPDDWTTKSNDFIHYGCRVLELDSLSPPTFAQSEDGGIVLHKEILATDQGELGSAACSYEPTAATGILMTKREITSTYLKASIHETGLIP